MVQKTSQLNSMLGLTCVWWHSHRVQYSMDISQLQLSLLRPINGSRCEAQETTYSKLSSQPQNIQFCITINTQYAGHNIVSNIFISFYAMTLKSTANVFSRKTTPRTVTTFVVSQSTRFQMWVKLEVWNQLRSHSCSIFMWRQFPVSNCWLHSSQHSRSTM